MTMSRILVAVSVVIAAVLVLAPIAEASVPDCSLTQIGKGSFHSGTPGKDRCWLSCPGPVHNPLEGVYWNIWVYDDAGNPLVGFDCARVHIPSYPDSVCLCTEETQNSDLPYIYPVGPSDANGMMTFLFQGSIHCTSDMCGVQVCGCASEKVWIHSVDLNLNCNPTGSGADAAIIDDVINDPTSPGQWSGKTGYGVYVGMDNCVDDDCGGGDGAIFENHLDHGFGTCTKAP
jgi:hypothetical protein